MNFRIILPFLMGIAFFWGCDSPTDANRYSESVNAVEKDNNVPVYFAGGNGSKENPYQIETIQQLQAIGKSVNLNKHFIQIADLDAYDTAIWNRGKGFKPIGDIHNSFTGTFNGNGFKISGLTINRRKENNVGMFGAATNAQIKHTKLVNVNISGGYNVGGLIGNNEAHISGSTCKGEVAGGYAVGGMVGNNGKNGVIEFSSAIVSIHELMIFFPIGIHGGLAGSNNGLIINSHAMGNISDISGMAGGLAGVNGENGKIIDSYSVSNVSGGFGVGGLVGNNAAHISGSFAAGKVSGSGNAGGLVGFNNENGVISTSYALGMVSGNRSVGGLVGSNWAIISESFAAGAVAGSEHVGGLIGSNNATVEFSYWDTEASLQRSGIGQGSPDGTAGLTTAQMTGSSAVVNMPDLDWINTWMTTTGYPMLKWQNE